MHILTVCQRGNVRSVTVATILKDFAGYVDVIPVGVETTTNETAALLSKWADIILVCGRGFDFHGKPEFIEQDKMRTLDIGYDTYGKAMHPALVRTCLEVLRPTGLLNGNHPFYETEDAYLLAVDSAYVRA